MWLAVLNGWLAGPPHPAAAPHKPKYDQPDTHTHTHTQPEWLERTATRWVWSSTLSPIFSLCQPELSRRVYSGNGGHGAMLGQGTHWRTLKWLRQGCIRTVAWSPAPTISFVCTTYLFFSVVFFRHCEPPKIFFFRKYGLIFLLTYLSIYICLTGPQTDSFYIWLFFTVTGQTLLRSSNDCFVFYLGLDATWVSGCVFGWLDRHVGLPGNSRDLSDYLIKHCKCPFFPLNDH